MTRKTLIAVIGGAQCDEAEYGRAEEVGRRLAEEGCVLVTGGLGGVMEAASKGARKAGGLVVGILPTGSSGDANPYVDVAVATGMGDARNAIIASSADAVIAVGGKLGTLSEIAFTLKRGKPVIGLGTWNLSGEQHPVKIIRADTPEEAVREALRSL